MTVNKAFALAGTLAVALVVFGGLYLGGSPSEQRLLRIDERRVDDLRMLSRVIRWRWDKTTRLPQELDELVDGLRLGSVPLDPITRSEYVFEHVSLNTYRLCADFSKSSVKPKPNDFWAHKAGYRCFTFTLVSKGEVN